MPRNVIVKFDKGEPHTYKKVPDSVSIDEVKKKAAQEFPDRKVVGVTEQPYILAPNPAPGGKEKPSVDIDKSSDAPGKSEPQDDRKDYRADFPNLYTPPGFIRNKRGDLIYY